MELLDETPDMHIGSGIKVQGDMKFEGLLKVDGDIDGRIVAPNDARVILTESSSYTGDLVGLAIAYINGKIVGEVNVGALTIGPNAIIYGDVTCKSIKIAKGSTIVGMLKVSPVCNVKSNFPESKSIIEGFERDSDDESLIDPNRRIDEDQEDDEEQEEIPEPVRSNRQILIICEPQVDFYNGGSWDSQPGGSGGGGLDVAERIAEFITGNTEEIDEIYVTLDSHNRLNVAQSSFWQNKNKVAPERGTTITASDVEQGVWMPKNEALKETCLSFLTTAVRNSIVIQPDHCLIGGQGSAIVSSVNTALNNWSDVRMRNVSYLVRKSTSFGEMNASVSATKLKAALSAAAAECDEVINSPTKEQRSFTMMDHFDLHFLSSLTEADSIFLCGQGSSHCSGFSMLDILQHCKELSEAQVRNDNTENADGSEAANKGLDISRVSILRDGISLASDQLHSCGSYVMENSAFTSVEEFWKVVDASGAKIKSVQDIPV